MLAVEEIKALERHRLVDVRLGLQKLSNLLICPGLLVMWYEWSNYIDFLI